MFVWGRCRLVFTTSLRVACGHADCSHKQQQREIVRKRPTTRETHRKSEKSMQIIARRRRLTVVCASRRQVSQRDAHDTACIGHVERYHLRVHRQQRVSSIRHLVSARHHRVVLQLTPCHNSIYGAAMLSNTPRIHLLMPFKSPPLSAGALKQVRSRQAPTTFSVTDDGRPGTCIGTVAAPPFAIVDGPYPTELYADTRT
jgi:hypothetical protein